MLRTMTRLSDETYDLAIIGGGIIGTGIARDAALRGIKTLLVDKEDFGYGTTSRSSRLIHGGIRYLQNMEFHLVRQDLHEREILLKIAPHLVYSYPFIMPMTTLYYNVALRIGVPLYDLMSFDKSIPSRTYLNRQKAIEKEPSFANLKGLTGAFIYYDCQAPNTERLGIENVISAYEHGATIINHAQVTGFIKKGTSVTGIDIKDTLTGAAYNIKTRLVINASGHWVDTVRGLLSDKQIHLVHRTKGIHLVTRKLCDTGLVLFSPVDNRLFFVMPWLDYSLIGTTDTDYKGDYDSVSADRSDVDYLIASIKPLFPDFTEKDIYYTMAGIRPLAHMGDEKPSKITREHKIVDHKQFDGTEGMITVLGGKITAYRAVAQEAVDKACKKLGLHAKCTTAAIPFPGAHPVPEDELIKASQDTNLPVETLNHLVSLYGSRYIHIIYMVKQDNRLAERICQHISNILAEIHYAVKEEMACTVSDFLLRRSLCGLEKCQAMDAVEKVAAEMGSLLHWNREYQQQQIAGYMAQTALTQSFRNK
jgi:glycerol-3-phosphate dehydrogenase